MDTAERINRHTRASGGTGTVVTSGTHVKESAGSANRDGAKISDVV
jgi:hypothetical protein